ncbi:MAG: hypothetical protein HYX28_11130 [Candidatus Koribacter versatilis]|uniref:Uncharacterized protein n=1 Tax=Candidatus Korobacter versatilis TaxID=658062 RepID=A0A932AAF3_9BACT|nr:hypothetical protein [Candidatus Koribacter versatilis]
MWENFIGREIRRCNRNLLTINVIVLVIVGAVVAFNWGYLTNWFRGTAAIDPLQIAKLQSADDLARNFVKFDVPEVLESGFQEVEEKDGKVVAVKADYQITWVGGRALVLKTKPNSTNTHLEGALVKVPNDVMAALKRDVPAERQGVLLPFMLDTVDYRDDGWWILGLCVPMVALALWNLNKWSRRMNDPASHPIVKTLGGEPAVVQYGPQLDMEMTGGGEKVGAATLTPSFLVVPNAFHTNIARLEDAAWVYKKITKHSVNFIPTGKTYEAVVWTRTGTMISVNGKEAQVEQLLATVATRAPWVVGGFSAELDNAWKKDRAGFLAAVDQRRGAAKGASAGAAK